MTIKKLMSPKTVDYPITVATVAVSTGDTIAKGDTLYDLRTATGQQIRIRSPLAGRLTGPVWSEGTVLDAPRILVSVDDDPGPEEFFADVADEPVREPEPEPVEDTPPAREAAPAAKPAAEVTDAPSDRPTASHESVGDLVLKGGLVALGFALPLVTTYVALHIAHSPLPLWIGVCAIAVALVVPLIVMAVVRDQAVGTATAFSALLIALPLAGLSFVTQVQKLVALDSTAVHRLLLPLVGGRYQVENGTLLVLGRPVVLQETKNPGQPMRLNDKALLIRQTYLYTADGTVINMYDRMRDDGLIPEGGWIHGRCAASGPDRFLDIDDDYVAGNLLVTVSLISTDEWGERAMDDKDMRLFWFDGTGTLIKTEDRIGRLAKTCDFTAVSTYGITVRGGG